MCCATQLIPAASRRRAVARRRASVTHPLEELRADASMILSSVANTLRAEALKQVGGDSRIRTSRSARRLQVKRTMSYPASLSPAKPSLGFLSPARGAKSRARREPSGVFSLFQTSQIQQFKEAFSLIDQDGDGIVTEADLKGIFGSLGN